VSSFLTAHQHIIYLKWINQLEGDIPAISATTEASTELKNHFTATWPKSSLTKKHEKEMLASLEDHKDFCLKMVHFATNLLYPHFTGRDLSEQAAVLLMPVNISARWHLATLMCLNPTSWKAYLAQWLTLAEMYVSPVYSEVFFAWKTCCKTMTYNVFFAVKLILIFTCTLVHWAKSSINTNKSACVICCC